MQTLTAGLSTKARSLKALLATFIIVLMACSNMVLTAGEANSGDIVQQPVKMVDDRLITATSRFAFKLYGEVLKQRTAKNVFVSPASVMLALAMTYNGAEGDTRQAMAQALEIERMSLDEVNRAFADLKSILGTAEPKLQLKIANSLWANQKVSFKPAFIQRNKDYYAAEVTNLDFGSPDAPDTINSWVRRNTENKIDKVIDKIRSDAILYLINAIYFKGQWKYQFEKEKTKEERFRLGDGSQKKLPMMYQSGRYIYYKGKDFQAVALPYGTGRISMYVFLPDEHKTLDQFERNLTIEDWEIWMKSFRLAKGEVMLPRFRVDYEDSLNNVLKALGMSEAFDPGRANFSGMVGLNQGVEIYISEVKHKSFAEVNEEGTEAAAVTSVGMSVTSVGPPEENFIMKVDRPFFFAIRDQTGAVLFMGSVRDPG